MSALVTMLAVLLARFVEVWVFDFEFAAPAGEPPTPVCMVARELRTRRTLRVWQHELGHQAPFSIGSGTLCVAFYASAEVGCFLALGWPVPCNVLDLYVEFRMQTNGVPTPCGSGLLGALAYFGEDAIDAAEKDSMRELAQRRGLW